jgi:uracil-DNA glycosylase
LDLKRAEAQARACTLCAPVLPLGPRPILQVGARARLLITSQAPGTKAHLSGIPFQDASGIRLRDWLGLDEAVFYDPDRVAILPTGFCYPGRLPRVGDAPPRPECAPLWHPRLLPLMP